MTNEERTQLAELGRQLAETASGLATLGRQVEEATTRVAECAQDGGYMANDLLSLPDQAQALVTAAQALVPAAQAISDHFDAVRTTALARVRSAQVRGVTVAGA